MIMNYLTRLYCGMVYRMSHGDGTETTQTTKRTKPHFESGPGEPEDELKELLVDIRTRVYLLKEAVEEQSREIESDLDDIPRAVEAKRDE